MNRILTITLLFLAQLAIAQSSEQVPSEVYLPIKNLFDGMRASDSSQVRSAFIFNATMQTVVKTNNEVRIQTGDLTGFLKAVGTPKQEIWDEQIGKVWFKIDQEMALVWTEYRFIRGGTYSHCGVNAFTLVKQADGWKILSVTDTRRKECAP